MIFFLLICYHFSTNDQPQIEEKLNQIHQQLSQQQLQQQQMFAQTLEQVRY